MTNHHEHYDVCICGGGIVGHTLALALARERLRVGLVAAPPASGRDVRAYALNAKSRDLLQRLRCWPGAPHATAVTAIQVAADGGAEVNFSATELGVEALSWIVDVPILEALLRDALRYAARIELLESPVVADLTVVCEGKSSRTRDEFGVDYIASPYPQRAIAARLRGTIAHSQVARQWFNQGEILAFLPLQGEIGDEVAVVFSVSDTRAQALLNVSGADFCAELGQVSANCLGSLELISERFTWPLQSAQASRWVGCTGGQSWALAGDAAHSVHPLAGQGLNLGLADVAELTKLVCGRDFWRPINDPRLLRQYERARRSQFALTNQVMDALQQLFSKSGAGWQNLRNWGMRGFTHSAWLKQWVARQAMGV